MNKTLLSLACFVFLVGLSGGVSADLFAPGDFARRIRSGNHFAVRIAKGPKLFLVGTADEFKQLIKSRET